LKAFEWQSTTPPEQLGGERAVDRSGGREIIETFAGLQKTIVSIRAI
jgi:hypothetical protein